MTPEEYGMKYKVTTDKGWIVASGTAKEIIDKILKTDPDMKGMGLVKKPVVYWKIGLTTSAAKV